MSTSFLNDYYIKSDHDVINEYESLFTRGLINSTDNDLRMIIIIHHLKTNNKLFTSDDISIIKSMVDIRKNNILIKFMVIYPILNELLKSKSDKIEKIDYINNIVDLEMVSFSNHRNMSPVNKNYEQKFNSPIIDNEDKEKCKNEDEDIIFFGRA